MREVTSVFEGQSQSPNFKMFPPADTLLPLRPGGMQVLLPDRNDIYLQLEREMVLRCRWIGLRHQSRVASSDRVRSPSKESARAFSRAFVSFCQHRPSWRHRGTEYGGEPDHSGYRAIQTVPAWAACGCSARTRNGSNLAERGDCACSGFMSR